MAVEVAWVAAAAVTARLAVATGAGASELASGAVAAFMRRPTPRPAVSDAATQMIPRPIRIWRSDRRGRDTGAAAGRAAASVSSNFTGWLRGLFLALYEVFIEWSPYLRLMGTPVRGLADRPALAKMRLR